MYKTFIEPPKHFFLSQFTLNKRSGTIAKNLMAST